MFNGNNNRSIMRLKGQKQKELKETERWFAFCYQEKKQFWNFRNFCLTVQLTWWPVVCSSSCSPLLVSLSRARPSSPSPSCSSCSRPGWWFSRSASEAATTWKSRKGERRGEESGRDWGKGEIEGGGGETNGERQIIRGLPDVLRTIAFLKVRSESNDC